FKVFNQIDMDRKEYFPPIWSDDIQMAGLMSMTKAREVNPCDYDRKIKFWSEMIARSCLQEKDPIVAVDLLKRRFRRGDQLPGSLGVVIESMHGSGELLTVEDFKARDQGWMQWGYSRVIGSLWGNGTNSAKLEYVHLPTVRELANHLLDFYRSNHTPEDDMSPEIVALDDFRDECRHLVANGRVFQLVLSELVHRGELTIGTSKIGEQILKFRDGSVRGPIEWTESDASVHDMRRAMSKLEHEIKRLEEKAKKAEQEARSCIRCGDRTRAAHHLRQKKRAMQEVEAKDNQYQRLLEMMHQLGQTRQNKQIMDAYKAGASAFKATLQRQGIQPEQIDETMDSISDAMATAEEIREAISTAVPSANGIDDAELEAELNSILAEKKIEEKEQPIVGLPEVPVEEPHVEPTLPEESLAQRLKRLRESAS
uniref:Charged multivesicular body protein 7 n=1 Tax=Parascaris univalens TaxID=6257 RepID=A0A915A5V8_PARUN